MGPSEGRSGLAVTYRVEFRPAALRALKRIDHQDRDRVRGVIALLSKDPRPPGAKALQGRQGLRVRVGNYRIIYTVDDGRLIVAVITLGHRKDVYDL